jgi:hypothetical protein
MENQVIKVLTPEHGKKVIEYWKSKGENTDNYFGCSCESDGDKYIYYGVISGVFDNYSINQISDDDNVEIIELPEEEFDMSTYEGILAYAKKHYPIDTRYVYYGTIYTVDKESSHIKDENYIHWQVYNHYSNTWAKIIKEDPKQEEKVMETQKLSRQGLKEIHGVACSYWKGKLQGMGIRNPFENYVDLTQEEVDEMFKACTKEQLPIVSKYLKQDDGSVDVMQFRCDIYDKEGRSVIQKRFNGEYARKSLLLDHYYNWEIKKDDEGYLCLIPTKKK